MAFGESFGMSGSGKKLEEGRAGAPGDQALLQRTDLGKVSEVRMAYFSDIEFLEWRMENGELTNNYALWILD